MAVSRGAYCASSLLLALLVALVVVNAARLPPDAAPSTIASVDKAASERMDGIDWPHRRTVCEDINFRKSSLKLIKEMPFIGLFEDLKVRGARGARRRFFGRFWRVRAFFYRPPPPMMMIAPPHTLSLPLYTHTHTHTHPNKINDAPKTKPGPGQV